MKKFFLQRVARNSTLVLLLLLAQVASAQIRIIAPSDRVVFQRNNGNQTSINVTGNVNQLVDVVQARFEPVQGGSDTGWQTIANNPQGGVFSGSVTVSGGWYRLSVRGVYNGNVIGTSQVDKVGVGEVFLIAGQSNAGSGSDPNQLKQVGQVGASDDRVNCINFSNFGNSGQDMNYPSPNYTHLDAFSDIAPRGTGSWCWGRLGDLLSSRLNVPIMFINVAWSGTSIRNWQESINGGTTASDFAPVNYAPGTPYGNLRQSLRYYCSYLGLRSVLWMQGEADTNPGRINPGAPEGSMDKDTYRNRLQAVINQSRSDFGKNITWAVARVSRTRVGGCSGYEIVSPAVIAGQNETINIGNQIFAGPETDGIQVPRADAECIHLSGQGLIDLANAWNNSLDNSFFSSSQPQTGSSLSLSSFADCGANRVTLSASVAGGSYSWSNGSGGASINVGGGYYSVRAVDGSGNIYELNNIEVPGNLSAAGGLSISSNVGDIVCGGASAVLTASDAPNYRWRLNGQDIGQSNNFISANVSGRYTVITQSAFGCVNESPGFNLTAIGTPAPSKPLISANGVTAYCEGGSISLSSSYNGGTNLWNYEGGQPVANSINTPTSPGIYNFQVRARDNNGCISEMSNTLTITVFKNPDRPNILAQPVVNLCEGQSTTLSSNYGGNGNLWNTGSRDQNIFVNSPGEYSVKFTDGNNCSSEFSNIVRVNINPLPPKPSITPLGATEFCRGGNVGLQSTNSSNYEWSNGQSGREIYVDNSGSFSVKVIDGNGCKSAQASDPVQVTVNELPATPTITAEGATTFCPDKNVKLISTNAPVGYIWIREASLATTDIPANQSVFVNKAGIYSVKVTDSKNCASLASNKIQVIVLPAPDQPQVLADGPVNFCDGNKVTLKSVTSAAVTQYVWREETSQTEISDLPSIPVTKSGIFSVKVIDGRGCFSEYSAGMNVKVYPLPQKPVITNLRPTIFCQEDSTMLMASLPNTTPNEATNSYRWFRDRDVLSSSARTIILKGGGTYSVQTVDAFNCSSDKVADSVKITVNPLPEIPAITLRGPNPFCADKYVVLTSSPEAGYKWSNNATSASITISIATSVFVRTVNKFNCISHASEAVVTRVNPLPPASSITAADFTTFCDGDSVKLTSSSKLISDWWGPLVKNGQTDSLNVQNYNFYAKKSGKYYVKVTDSNGCRSLFSQPIDISVKDLPFVPVIRQIGSYTLDAEQSPSANDYEWKYQGQLLPFTTQNIKSNKDGTYEVRARIAYTNVPQPNNQLSCYSKFSEKKIFKADPELDGLSVYPNPSTNGFITIETSKDLLDSDVIIYNMRGQIVNQYKVDNFNERKIIDLRYEGLSEFILKVRNGAFEKTKRVLLLR